MKTILITGGSGKVGVQLVSHFLIKGYNVVTTTRDNNRFIDSCQDLLERFASQLHIVQVDFLHENAIDIVNSFFINTGIQVNCIIHNARNIDFLKVEEDNSILRKNFEGEFYVDVVFPYQLTLLLLKSQGSVLNNIIFISSIYGVVAPTPSLYEDFDKSSPINYGVCKAAQIHLTKELAVRLAPKVRVNCISFGGILGRATGPFVEKYRSLTPQKRMIAENDVVGPVDFLVSELSKDMNGHNLIIDGGWTIW